MNEKKENFNAHPRRRIVHYCLPKKSLKFFFPKNLHLFLSFFQGLSFQGFSWILKVSPKILHLNPFLICFLVACYSSSMKLMMMHTYKHKKFIIIIIKIVYKHTTHRHTKRERERDEDAALPQKSFVHSRRSVDPSYTYSLMQMFFFSKVFLLLSEYTTTTHGDWRDTNTDTKNGNPDHEWFFFFFFVFFFACLRCLVSHFAFYVLFRVSPLLFTCFLIMNLNLIAKDRRQKCIQFFLWCFRCNFPKLVANFFVSVKLCVSMI